MSSVVAALDSNFYLVENPGGGDCLLYSFLCPVFHNAQNYDAYLKRRKTMVVVLRDHAYEFCKNEKSISKQDLSDAEEELGVPHSFIKTTLIGEIGKMLKLSVILVETDTNFNAGSGLYAYENPAAKYWIIIYYDERILHYRAVALKKGMGYKMIFHESDDVISKLRSKDFTKIEPVKKGNIILRESQVMVPV